MRLGLYTFAALAFIGLIAGFAYTLTPGNYVLEIAGLNINLPIALWMVLPLLLLLVFTILHMLYHGTRNYFVRRKWQRDADTMQDALYWSLIGEPKEHSYSVPMIREGASLLSSATLSLKTLPEGVSSKIAQTAEWVKQIQNGEYVDLKKKKVDRFMGKENPLLVKNELTRLSNENEYADEILRSRETHSQEVVDAAISRMLEFQTFFKMKQYANLLNFNDLAVLLDRADSGEDVGLTLDNLEYFIADMELGCQQYMRMVSSTVKAFDPDQNLAFFKKEAKDHSRAEAAYLFLLFRYEMIEKVENFLEEHDEDDFVVFRAFLSLKKHKFNYKARDFIVAENACK